MVAHAYRESFFGPQADGTHRIAMANARAGNVIGGGDWTPYQLIPDTVQAMIKGQQVVLRHPTATRPWLHVLDCLNGYLTLAEALHGLGFDVEVSTLARRPEKNYDWCVLTNISEIVLSHGGTIGLESRAGEGSEFYFDLPLAERKAA